MNGICGTCKNPLSKEGDMDYATCSICKNGYHFTSCSTLGESSWRTMGDSRRGAWKCTLCKEEKQASKTSQSLSQDPNKDRNEEVKNRNLGEQSSKTKDQSNTDGSKVSKKSDIPESKISMNELSRQLNSKIDDLQKSMSADMEKGFGDLEKKMNKKFEEMDEHIGKKLKDFEKTLNYYGDKVDEANDISRNVEKKLVLMEKRLDKSEKENVELRTKMSKMEKQSNGLAQKEFNTKIEISGIKNKNIDHNDVTKKILNKVNDTSEDIQFRAEKIVMKVGEEKQERTTIVVQLRSQEARNMVLTKIKSSKLYSKLNEIMPNEGAPVFFNEALSPYYKKLFFEAGRVKREKKYAFLWVKDGKILIKKEEKGNTLRLESMEDLGKL
uniref:FP protein C-terminal domain-containing protein n=1 Tax=Cacopsylla melanoneura TaxID=428564 RepID=A0A8D8UC70_9HEMI